MSAENFSSFRNTWWWWSKSSGNFHEYLKFLGPWFQPLLFAVNDRDRMNWCFCRNVSKTPWSFISNQGTGRKLSGRNASSIILSFAATPWNIFLVRRPRSSATDLHSGQRQLCYTDLFVWRHCHLGWLRFWTWRVDACVYSWIVIWSCCYIVIVILYCYCLLLLSFQILWSDAERTGWLCEGEKRKTDAIREVICIHILRHITSIAQWWGALKSQTQDSWFQLSFFFVFLSSSSYHKWGWFQNLDFNSMILFPERQAWELCQHYTVSQAVQKPAPWIRGIWISEAYWRARRAGRGRWIVPLRTTRPTFIVPPTCKIRRSRPRFQNQHFDHISFRAPAHPGFRSKTPVHCLAWLSQTIGCKNLLHPVLALKVCCNVVNLRTDQRVWTKFWSAHWGRCGRSY